MVLLQRVEADVARVILQPEIGRQSVFPRLP
jgi:hypothetical protein